MIRTVLGRLARRPREDRRTTRAIRWAIAATLLAAGALPEASATAAPRSQPAARYLAIAQAGNRRLEHDFDALAGADRNDLARARADLRDAAATERLFDRRLLGIAFPPATRAIARHLYRVNELRARLTYAASFAATLADLRSYEPVLDAANGPVELDVRAIRRALGLPPPATS
jgi:hypothetical protein